MSWDAYRAKFQAMGGIVEEFLEGADKDSPSAQFRVDPLGRCMRSRPTSRCWAG